MKKNYKSSQIIGLQIYCPTHDNLLITHGCLNLECKSDQILFCSSCLLENLEHLSMHQKYILPILNFLSEMFNQYFNIKENVSPLEKKNVKDRYLLSMELKDKKNIFSNELNALKLKINEIIDCIQDEFLLEFQQIDAYFDNKKNKMESSFRDQKNTKFNYGNKEDFIQTVKFMNSNELNGYFNEFRNLIKGKNSTEESENLQQEFNKILLNLQNLPNLYASKVKIVFDDLIKEFCQKFKETFTAFDPKKENELKEKSNCFGSNLTPIKKISLENSAINKNLSPLINNNSFRNFFPQNHEKQMESDIKTSKLMTSINNLTKMENFPIFETTSQKNFVIKNGLFFKKKDFLLKLEKVGCFEEQYPLSSLCVLNLNDSLLVTGGKDNIIRILEFKMLANNQSHIKLLKNLQNHNDLSPIWSLAKLSTINYQKNDYGIYYFASGSENGNISIWKFNYKLQKTTENTNDPLVELIGKVTTEIITCIADLNNGNHLVSGDSNGSIMLWDFLYGKLIKSFDIHEDQINSIITFSEDKYMAIGSYDGNISIWEILQTNEGKIDIKCNKKVENKLCVYSLNSFQTKKNNLIVVDSQKKLKILDIESLKYIKESQILTKSEGIMEILLFESLEDCIPLVFCFTQQQLIVLKGENLEPIKTFDSLQLDNQNIGLTMSSNYKVVFLSKNISPKLEKESLIYFALIDQDPKTKRVLSIFKICF